MIEKPGESIERYVRAGCTGSHECLQHVEILEAHLGHDNMWGVDSRCGESGAKYGTGTEGWQYNIRHL